MVDIVYICSLFFENKIIQPTALLTTVLPKHDRKFVNILVHESGVVADISPRIFYFS